MRANARFLTIVLFLAGVSLLPPPLPDVQAQYPNNVCKRQIDYIQEFPCSNCCAGGPGESYNEYTGILDSSPGYMSVETASVDCGGAASPPCTSSDCGTQTYDDGVVTDDSNCCSDFTMQCTNDSACCLGMACDITPGVDECVGCVGYGDYAWSQSDCCSGMGSYDNDMYQCE